MVVFGIHYAAKDPEFQEEFLREYHIFAGREYQAKERKQVKPFNGYKRRAIKEKTPAYRSFFLGEY